MTLENECHQPQGTGVPANGSSPENELRARPGPDADLPAECARLHQEILELVQQRDAYRTALEAVRVERDSFRRMAYDVARKYFEGRLPLTEEGFQSLLATETWEPLNDVLGELEQQHVKGS